MSQVQRIICRVCKVRIATRRMSFPRLTRVTATAAGEIVESDRHTAVVRCRTCTTQRRVML